MAKIDNVVAILNLYEEITVTRTEEEMGLMIFSLRTSNNGKMFLWRQFFF